MQTTYIAQQPDNAAPSNMAGKPPQMDYLLGAFIMALPVLAAIGFVGYRKHRSLKLRRQIIRLERLWLLETKERRS
ncbi:MAG TPA: hypothetical protein V6C57_23080 [Coleofasciculaceae cyanobacterium]